MHPNRTPNCVCQQCGKPFYIKLSDANSRRFCTKACHNASMRGEQGLTPANIERFWASIDRSGGDDACWPYMGSRDRYGYGRFSICQKRQRAHRVAAELTYGPCPDHLRTCHTCDNPPCCNPAHLYYGTAKDNTRDMIDRGRAKFFDLRETRGERHWKAKLTADDVREIRRLFAAGVSSRTIADRFSISVTHVYHVAYRKVWKHID